ncbi:MAG TPA: hypothetical protein VGZ29_05685 [Terriglobia bacterium]|nr:hypothetical protein [Terriglobia bacterium]
MALVADSYKDSVCLKISASGSAWTYGDTQKNQSVTLTVETIHGYVE